MRCRTAGESANYTASQLALALCSVSQPISLFLHAQVGTPPPSPAMPPPPPPRPPALPPPPLPMPRTHSPATSAMLFSGIALICCSMTILQAISAHAHLFRRLPRPAMFPHLPRPTFHIHVTGPFTGQFHVLLGAHPPQCILHSGSSASIGDARVLRFRITTGFSA